jgi:intracellular multiplication protein IcmW
MAKLDIQSAHEYWKNYNDMMIYRVVSLMEAMEDSFTQDGDAELEKHIDKLADTLDQLTNLEIGKEEHFVKLATFLKMPRLLYMLQTIDTIEPGSASKMLMYAEGNSSKDTIANLFLRRNIVFERLRLLSRVFSSERFSTVLKATENE